MKKRIISPEQQSLIETKKYYDAQKAKSYNYSADDFEVDLLTNKWRHKSWKTWMKGEKDYSETKKLINKYIDECKKPYGTRNLSGFHLFHSTL